MLSSDRSPTSKHFTLLPSTASSLQLLGIEYKPKGSRFPKMPVRWTTQICLHFGKHIKTPPNKQNKMVKPYKRLRTDRQTDRPGSSTVKCVKSLTILPAKSVLSYHILATHILFWSIHDFKTHFKCKWPTAVYILSAPFSRNGHSTTTWL